MRLEVLEASKGDSFFLSWGKKNEYNLLIDTGSPGTYKKIKRKLILLKKLEAVIISHVDYDHIGGIFKLINDETINLEYKFYINTPSLVLLPSNNDKVGIEHGIKFEKKLKDKKIHHENIYLKKYKDDTLRIKGLKLKILSPSEEVLKELMRKWTAERLYHQYLIESKSSDKTSAISSKLSSYDKIIKENLKAHNWKNDLVNASSIAFIAEHSQNKILFLADANPTIICEKLKLMGYSKKIKLKVNLVKLSHHGSKFNTTKELLEIIDCKNFIISTKGTGPYYHPHRETIIRLAEYSRENRARRINIYTNYPLNKGRFITPKEEEDWNLNIVTKTKFEL